MPDNRNRVLALRARDRRITMKFDTNTSRESDDIQNLSYRLAFEGCGDVLRCQLAIEPQCYAVPTLELRCHDRHGCLFEDQASARECGVRIRDRGCLERRETAVEN